MRAKGKILLENTLLTITYGRRYGLVGPNGMGKSTLLRMLARRQIPVPDGLDVLLVEQVWLHCPLSVRQPSPVCVSRSPHCEWQRLLAASLNSISYKASP